MKRLIVSLALAATVAAPVLTTASQAAAAQAGRGRPAESNGRGPAAPAYRGPPAANRGAPNYSYRGPPQRQAPQPQRWDPQRYNGYYYDNRWYYGAPPASYYNRPGYAPAYSPWQRGQVLPPAYRGSYISDYRGYGLRPPPAGYRWYYSNGDYILAAVATGLIFDLILGNH